MSLREWLDPKEFLYKLVRQDSRNMGKIGEELGWDWLEQEGEQNKQDPSRALRKAALSAATWYLGGAAGGAAGGAGGAASGAAGAVAPTVAAAAPVASNVGLTAAEVAAKEAALQAMQQGGAGLLSMGETAAPMVSESMMAAPDFARESANIFGNSLYGQAATQATRGMVPGLTSADPMSQAAMLAQQNAGMGPTGLARTAEAASTANGLSPMAQFGGRALGAADRGLLAANDFGQAYGKAQQAMGLLGGNQQPQPAPPPPPNQFQPTPVSNPYGMDDSPPPGIDPRQWAMMSPEQKRRFKGGMA